MYIVLQYYDRQGFFVVAVLKVLLAVLLFFSFLLSSLLFKGLRVHSGNLLMFGRKHSLQNHIFISKIESRVVGNLCKIFI